MASPPSASRGDVWLVDLNPTRGHEQSGKRPALVVSVGAFNQGPAGLVVVLPITSRQKGIPFHVPLKPPEGGVSVPSWIKCEDVRSVSVERLHARWGTALKPTMEAVGDRLRILMDL